MESKEDEHVVELVYAVGVPVMMSVCVAAVAVNARCVLAVRWIRGPLSPTMRLSLSLAAADMHVSLLSLVSFAVNSLLRRSYDIGTAAACTMLVLEGLRFGAIVTVVAHLIALAFNHLLGIVKPLRYPVIATPGKIRLLAFGLWIVPPIIFLLLWGPLAPEHEALRAISTGCAQSFLIKCTWRTTFVCLALLLPLAAMCVVYTYVLWALKRRTDEWAQHKRNGSRKSRGRVVERQSVGVSRRAVYTTLTIVGSFVALYVPAMAAYVLVCSDGCVYTHWKGKWIWLNWIIQALLVAKPLVNPLIYASRMPELREATRRMHAAANSSFCAWRRSNEVCSVEKSPVACRLTSDGNGRITVVTNNDTTTL